MPTTSDTGVFYSAEEQIGIETLFDLLHNTHQKDVYAWVEEESSVPSGSSYNALFGRTLDQDYALTNRVLTKHTLKARVYYPKPNDEERLRDIGLPSSELLVRLKIHVADLNTINNASKIEVDGDLYSIVSDSKQIGPFAKNYIEIWLKRNT